MAKDDVVINLEVELDAWGGEVCRLHLRGCSAFLSWSLDEGFNHATRINIT